MQVKIVKIWLPILVFVLLIIILFWRIIFFSEVLLPGDYLAGFQPWAGTAKRPPIAYWDALLWDGMAQYYPWRLFYAQSIQQGILPLWNPYEFAGYPFLANCQSAIFYPLNFLFCWLDVSKAFGYSVMIHLFLAGLFMYIFSRSIGLDRFSSTLSGIIYMFSGFFITRLELITYVNVGIWLPLMLFLVEKAVGNRKWAYHLSLGLVIGVTILAGHLQIWIYLMLALVLYYFYRLVCVYKAERDVKAVGKLILGFALAVIIGLTLGAVQILPTLEIGKHSHRYAPATWEIFQAYNRGALPLHNLIAFLIPDFFGKPFAEYCGYVGILPIFLSILAVCFNRNRYTWFFAILAIFALLVALGTPLGALLFFLVPGFHQFGTPSRILLIYTICVAVLAGLGSNFMLTKVAGCRRKIVWAVCMISGGIVVFGGLLGYLVWNNVRGLSPISFAEFWELESYGVYILFLLMAVSFGILVFWLKNKISWELFVALSIGLIVVNLFTFGINYTPITKRENIYPSTNVTHWLKSQPGPFRILPISRGWGLAAQPVAVLPPNSPMVYKLYDIQGYDSLYLRGYRTFLSVLEEGRDPSPPENGNMILLRNYRSKLVDLLGVKYVLTLDVIEAFEVLGFKLVGSPGGPVIIYENRNCLPRAFVVYKAKIVRNSQEVLKELSRDYFRPGEYVIFTEKELRAVGLNRIDWEARALTVSSPWDAKVLAYSPNKVVLRADLKQGGFLVLSDIYFPGWRAKVDGREGRLLRVDYILRGIYLDEGLHKIVFEYKPLAFQVGLYMILLTLFSITLWLSCKFVGRKSIL